MFKLVEIASRNIFRNFQRSILTIVMVFLAVTVIVAGSSFLTGMLSSIAEESVRLTGNVRVTSKNHDLKEKAMSLAGNISDYSKKKEPLSSVNNVKNVVGQIKFNSVIYNSDKSRQGFGYGIEEDSINILKLKEQVYDGKLFSFDAKDEALVGRDIAENLNLKVGDEITLLGKGLNDSYKSKYKVVGFCDFGNTLLNKSFFVSLTSAQDLLEMPDKVTEILVYANTSDDTNKIMNDIQGLEPFKDLETKPWNDIGMGALLIGIVKVVSTIAQLVLISLAAFGITNTVMMAVLERKGEIGLLKSMGMHESEVVILFTLEGVILGVIGIFCGLLIGGIAAFVLSTHGLNLGNGLEGFSVKLGGMVYGGFTPGIFIKGISFGLGATLVATLIPVSGVVRLKPSEALRK